MHGRCTHGTIAALLTLPLALACAACGNDPVTPPDGDPTVDTFGFDQDLEGWTPDGTDLDDPPVDWSIEWTSDPSASGGGSVEFFLDNINDQGKIWIERAFDLEPNTTYDVELAYAFGTSDWGAINLWTIIAGVHVEPPETREDLTFQEDTGHGAEEDLGLVWTDRAYELTATTGEDGRLWVAIGVWGTWETPRTYFVDDVELTFTPR